MERIWKIWEHPLYREKFFKLQEAERERIFCRHDFAHFLDVARICYIYSLEAKTAGEDIEDISKEIIYAAALLHDIGRYDELITDISHEKVGAKIAEKVLVEAGFDRGEILIIIEAILSHREKSMKRSGCLAEYLYEADKAARQCFCCSAYEECNWNDDKKNREIRI